MVCYTYSRWVVKNAVKSTIKKHPLETVLAVKIGGNMTQTMERYTRKEREYYNKDREIICGRLNITENQYNWLRRKGQLLHKIYEDNCNGIVQTDDEYFGLTVPIEKEIKTYLKRINKGLHVYFQTDPRGATIYVSHMTLNDRNYNQGQCIY